VGFVTFLKVDIFGDTLPTLEDSLGNPTFAIFLKIGIRWWKSSECEKNAIAVENKPNQPNLQNFC
jgi:hypothetical protein